MTADLHGATWTTASRSQGANNCVEVGRTSETVGVRDTKDRDGGTLAFDRAAFATFTAAIKDGRLGG